MPDLRTRASLSLVHTASGGEACWASMVLLIYYGRYISYNANVRGSTGGSCVVSDDGRFWIAPVERDESSRRKQRTTSEVQGR